MTFPRAALTFLRSLRKAESTSHLSLRLSMEPLRTALYALPGLMLAMILALVSAAPTSATPVPEQQASRATSSQPLPQLPKDDTSLVVAPWHTSARSVISTLHREGPAHGPRRETHRTPERSCSYVALLGLNELARFSDGSTCQLEFDALNRSARTRPVM